MAPTPYPGMLVSLTTSTADHYQRWLIHDACEAGAGLRLTLELILSRRMGAGAKSNAF